MSGGKVATSESLKRKHQIVDVNILPIFPPISFCLIFEYFPIWILALEPVWTKSVVLFGYATEAQLLAHLERCGKSQQLYLRLLHRFGSSRIQYCCDLQLPPTTDVILLSGSLSYLKSYFGQLQTFQQPIIGTVDGHFHQRFKFGRPLSVHRDELQHVCWHRIRHETVGGATTLVTVHGTINCSSIGPNVTSIRRTIGDFLNYRVRPKFLSDIKACHQPPLLVSDRVSPLYWDQAVAYQTYFFASGWGIRSLSPDELGAIFSLPGRVRMGNQLSLGIFDWITPIQSLLSVLHPVLTQFTISNPATHKRQKIPSSDPILLTGMDPFDCPQSPPVVLESRSWIPSIGRWLPHSWIVADVITTGAAKRDDASIPTYLWNKRLQLLYPWCSDRHLDSLRSFLLIKVVRRNVLRSFRAYLRSKYGPEWALKLDTERSSQRSRGEGSPLFPALLHDVHHGLDVLFRLTQCTWWDWNVGSALIFWRWPVFLQAAARDGMTPFLCGTLPTFRRRSRLPNPSVLPLIASKFETIITRKYLAPGPIKSLTQFFDVPKGIDDIRLVYNGTSCGFNSALWCPKFWLPTPKSALRSLDYNFYSVDMDLAEMFLNFPLHSTLQEYSGVDLTPYKSVLNIKSQGRFHLRWTRTWMGARPSPYCAVRYYYIAEDFVRGNHLDPNNPFYWDSIILNLPGSASYDPSRPRVIKWNSLTQSIAAEVIVYVDDLRIQGRDVETAWRLAHVIASRLQYLGIQVAIRKHRPPTKTPGAWAGAIFRTSSESVSCSVSKEKWEKAQRIINDLIVEMESHENIDNTLNYKNLEISRGFLVHLSMTFDVITPYLKGFHLALAAHNTHRDEEGWKLKDHDWLNYLQMKVDKGVISESERNVMVNFKRDPDKPLCKYNPPSQAKIVSQLRNDLFALKTFFSSDQPPEFEVRKKNVSLLLYGFADASGGGLGSTVLIPGKGIRYRVGVWGSDSEETSSNFREFENVVQTVEEEAKNGTLNGSLMFLFTDNSTVEAALYKGNSTSEKLFRLVVRLRKVELDHDATITVVHVAGKRMIAQGTDGISRGQLNEGVATGIPMLNFVPLHQSALERQPSLQAWIRSWMGVEAEFLQPCDWFIRGHDVIGGYYDSCNFWQHEYKPGKFVWFPPPAAADVALEEIRKAVIKRQDSTHVFICPRLMTPEWRRQLSKVADIVFALDAGCDVWPSEMFEPLTFGFVFPLLTVRPWQRQGTPKMRYMARVLPKMLQASDVAAGSILRKFCVQNWKLSTLPEPVVRAVLYFEG